MNNFNRTAIKAETDARILREREADKLCKSEISNSINHLFLSFEKVVDQLGSELTEQHRSHIDNVYYHVGRIRGCI